MKTKIRDLINFYKDSWICFGKKVNINKAAIFLEKYGLSTPIYKKKWEKSHNSIFDLNKKLPDMIFKKNFEYVSLLGGVLFEKKDFIEFKACLKKMNEKEFVVIQDDSGVDPKLLRYTLKMEFPTNIQWKEMTSGSCISTVLLEDDMKHYYIFGKSGKWGMYAANDYLDRSVNPAGTPINIIGFDPAYSNIFRDVFQIPDGEYCENVDYIPQEERPNLKEWVPKAYRN